MGIKGLLPFLKDIQQSSDLKKFKGETVGVDTYCWLHRGTYSCAKDLVLGNPTDKYVQFVMNRVALLLKYEITPIMVFDGGRLPAKNETNKKRSEIRKQNKEIAMELLAKGEKTKAFEYFQRCVSVTPEMASRVIQECKKLKVSCIVAPYEADAQLAYLYRKNIITLAISEDTDLLVFGCDKVFYKMDSNGKGVLVDYNRISKLKLFPNVSPIVERRLFRYLCILSGCDYLNNIRGIGMKTAYSLLKQNNDIYKIIKELRLQKGTDIVPLTYENDFKYADTMFLNQLVYDIGKCILVEIGSNVEHDNFQSDDFVYNRQQIIEIALGNLNPITNQIISNNTLGDFPFLFSLTNQECHKLFDTNSTISYDNIDESNKNIHYVNDTVAKTTKVLKRINTHTDKPLYKSKYFTSSSSSSLSLSLSPSIGEYSNNIQSKSVDITLTDSILVNSQGSIPKITADNELFTPPLKSHKYSGNFKWDTNSSSQQSQESLLPDGKENYAPDYLPKWKNAIL